MPDPDPSLPALGVVVVTHASADVILDCLDSLLASQGVRLAVAVVDNASPDGTPALIRDWAAGRLAHAPGADVPFALDPVPKPLPLAAAPPAVLPAAGHSLALIETGINGGFAAGVNRGLAALAAVAELDRFWILNPDSLVPPGSAAAFARHPAPPGGFALMGGRLAYAGPTGPIQIDGGVIRRWSGVTGNLGQFAPIDSPPPDPARIDFVTGASMVASRAFLETAGPMPEDYFLYYEEVDWALRRGRLPLLWCPGGLVYHRAGTAIGSSAPGRPASRFSLYFKHRGRMRFVRRHFPAAWPTALAFSLAKAGQSLLKGDRAGAATILGASLEMAPPAAVRARLSPEAAELAFAPWRRSP